MYVYVCIYTHTYKLEGVNAQVISSDVTYCRSYIMTRRDSFLPSADKASVVCKAVQLKSAAGEDFLHPAHLKIGSH
jgi:hypothetical protein